MLMSRVVLRVMLGEGRDKVEKVEREK